MTGEVLSEVSEVVSQDDMMDIITITYHYRGFSTQVTTLSGQLTKPGFFLDFHLRRESNRGQRNIQLKLQHKYSSVTYDHSTRWDIHLLVTIYSISPYQSAPDRHRRRFSHRNCWGIQLCPDQQVKRSSPLAPSHTPTGGSAVTGMLPHRPKTEVCQSWGWAEPPPQKNRKNTKSCTTVCIFLKNRGNIKHRNQKYFLSFRNYKARLVLSNLIISQTHA